MSGRARRRPRTRAADCATPSEFSPRTLAEVVADYRAGHQKNACIEHDFFKRQANLTRAVTLAARARTADGKRHPHQRRIPESVLARAERALQTCHRELRAAKAFDEVHAVVAGAIGSIRGIGELTVYDTSTRLGSFLRLRPTSVYLHAGVRDGARALGLDTGGERIPLAALPHPLGILGGSAAEDMLCIYKDSPAFARTQRRAAS